MLISLSVTSGGATIATTSETSVTYNGVTWNFNTSVPVGRFDRGIKDDAGNRKPFVVSSSGFEITSVTPASAVVDTRQAHGLEENPYYSATSAQGFDQILNDTTITTSTYNGALNIDPGATGANISVSSGANKTFVKSVRKTGAGLSSWQVFDRFSPLTVLSVAPPQGAFAPSASAVTKTMWTWGDVDQSVLRSLTLPASVASYASAAALVPNDLGIYGRGSSALRLYRLDADLGYATTNYSAQLAKPYSEYIAQLHSDAITTQQREEVIERVIDFGIQIYGNTTRGFGQLASRNSGAGQQGAIHPWLYYGAFLLQDTTMLAAAKAMNSNMNATSFWIQASDVGRAVSTLSSSGTANSMTFLEEMVGMPDSNPEDENALIHAAYVGPGGSILAWETLVVEMLQNGPGGVSGTTALLDGGAFDNTNSKAAHVAYMDRIRTWQPRTFLDTADFTSNSWKDLYDQMAPLNGRTEWTGVPDILPYGNGAFSSLYDDDMFSVGAGSGEIDYNINSRDFATEAVTQYDVAYSLDGRQFIESLNVGSSGTLAGLLRGAQHYCKIRQQSASGAGPWSLNIPTDTGDVDPGIVTTTGTATNAIPTMTTAPKILYSKYPKWTQGAEWADATTLDVNTVELAAGVGYWSGFPSPTFALQWQESANGTSGWTDITTANGYDTDATNALFSRRAENASQYIRCKVTATNSEGATDAFTNSVQCPALTTFAAGTIIDTDLKASFAVDWESVADNLQSNAAANPFHRPNQTFDDFPSASEGAIQGDKVAGWPSVALWPVATLVDGTTYRVQAELVASEDFIGVLYFSVRRQNFGTHHLSEGEITFDAPTTAAGIYTVDTTFVAGVDGDVEVRFGHTTPGGGTAGGDPYLTKISIAEV